MNYNITWFAGSVGVDGRHSGDLAVGVELPCAGVRGDAHHDLSGRGAGVAPVGGMGQT